MHKGTFYVVASIMFFLVSSVVVLPQTPQEALGLPAPRVYENPKITTVEELMPYARTVITREEWTTQWPGLQVKGGETVLFIVDTRTDPLVTEAFLRAFREKGCRVDLIVREKVQHSRIEDLVRAKVAQEVGHDTPKWLEDASKEYDIVFGMQFIDRENRIYMYHGSRLEYTNREKLASSATTYPDELLQLIEKKIWDVIKRADVVRITDPQGTDVSFTWFDEWWEVLEGTHPTIKIPGISRTRVYRREATALPMIGGHLDVHPRSGMIERANFTGIVVGNMADLKPVPMIKVHHKNNRITKVEGGGVFGDTWRKLLDETKDIQYEYYPEPGTAYMCEISMGTHPKYRGTMKNSGLEGLRRSAGWNWGDARMRSGVIHIAYGAYDAKVFANETDNVVNHFHVYLYFPTYTVTTKDGETIDLIKDGRLTFLDDPEVRRLASKYGDPDELLSEDWIPIFNPETKELEPPVAKN